MTPGDHIGRVTILRRVAPVRFVGRNRSYGVLAKRVRVRCACGSEWVALESNVTASDSYGCRDRACRERRERRTA